MRGKIIRNLKSHKRLVVITTIILVSGFVFIIGIYIPSKEIYDREFIVIDDTYHSGRDHAHTINGNKTLLIAGRYNNETWSSWFYSYLQFDLTNKPKVWENCELSIYITEYNRGDYIKEYRILRVVLFYGTEWNELMTGDDILDIYGHSTTYYTYYYPFGQFKLGNVKISITDYIEGFNESVSIMIGFGGADEESIIYYSKEANVNRAWLPQLIWS